MEDRTPATEEPHSAGSGINGESPLLTPQELESYHRDGYIVPRFRFSPEEVARLYGLVTRLAADNPDLADFLMPTPHITSDGKRALRTFPGWMEFATHPTILDMIEQIVGPDIILRGTAAFYKRAGKGPATAWHQDANLLPIYPLESTHVWIAATNSTVENACLRFIPGTHKSKSCGKHTYAKRHDDGTVGPKLDEAAYDASKAVDLEIEAGQMIIHDVFTVHASRSNLGVRERASYALRFMPATSFFNHDATPPELRASGDGHHNRPLVLVRGVNRAGSDLRRGHPVAST